MVLSPSDREAAYPWNPRGTWSIDRWLNHVGLASSDELETPPLLLWVDCETTGLNEKRCSMLSRDRLLEAAFVVTDVRGDVVPDGVFYSLVYDHTYTRAVLGMGAVAERMHRDSGLIEDLDSIVTVPSHWRNVYLHPNAVSKRFDTWFQSFEWDGQPELCGSSVGFDRMFLEQDLPYICSSFYYRSIDVSSLKQICRKVNPRLFARWHDSDPDEKPHRALLDVAQSIKEYKFYLKHFLVQGE